MLGDLVQKWKAWWYGYAPQQQVQRHWWQWTPRFYTVCGGEPASVVARLLPEPSGLPFKANVARRIYRVPVGSEVIYWKESRVVGLRGWLRELLRLPKARIEFENAVKLTRLGIPTVEPLAWGCERRWWPGTSYFVSRELPQAVPLRDFLLHTFPCLPQRRQIRLRQQLARRLGHLLASLHEQGVVHPDLHPGNLLLVPPADDEQLSEIRLVDLHAVRFRTRALCWSESRANLILFNRWFQLRASRTDRLRFWRAYVHGRASWQSTNAAVHRHRIAEVEALTLRSNQRLWQARQRRYIRASRHCQQVVAGPCRGLAVRDLKSSLVQYWMQNVDAWINQAEQSSANLVESTSAPGVAVCQSPNVQLLKKGASSAVLVVGGRGVDVAGAFVIKRFELRHWYEPLQHLLRWSPAWRAWRYGHALLDRGLPTPRPLAVWHRYRWGLPCQGYLVTEYVADAVPLQRGPEQVQLEALARLLRLLHDRGLSHRDLKGDNILVTSAGLPLLIDLVGVRSFSHVSSYRRIKDLMRLNVSFWHHPQVRLSQRLRFLFVYAAVFPRLWVRQKSRPWKKWWIRIRLESLAKLRRWSRLHD
ncbi:MAG: phosphotransferase [Gemmataceae bacterium]|nr:phosphotransferase [Gemmataceae bacterium]MDW8242063.1 lipopolysaccharide kinase InaA family protein [Thermogemmata sp.]